MQNFQNGNPPGGGGPTATYHAGPSGRQIYDGKRMRKAITRRTIDHHSSIIRYLEDRHHDSNLRKRLYSSLQPNPSHIINLLPPSAYDENPLNAVTTKFVHLSLNKQRCPVNAVRWTPDGRRLLTGTATGEFTLWNGMTFNFETILQAHETAIRAMGWSHNGNFLVTGDHSGCVKVWQPSMNNLKVISNGHEEPVRQVTFSPNDSKFATCSDDGTVKIWDFEEMLEERTLTGHGWDVKTIHWHPFKAILASGSKDNLIKLWDPRSGTNVATIHGHKNNILDVKWNKNGNWLLSASKDQIVKLFDIRMIREEMQTFRAHKKEVNSIAWHPIHEALFASAGAEGAIHYHLVNQEEPVGSLEGAHDGIIWSLDWHPLGHILTSGSMDCSARFWTRHRPGDSIQDRYILGRQAAEALGISESTVDLDENDDQDDALQFPRQLPGLGGERRPPPFPLRSANEANNRPPMNRGHHHQPQQPLPGGLPPRMPFPEMMPPFPPPPGFRMPFPLPPHPPMPRPFPRGHDNISAIPDDQFMRRDMRPHYPSYSDYPPQRPGDYRHAGYPPHPMMSPPAGYPPRAMHPLYGMMPPSPQFPPDRYPSPPAPHHHQQAYPPNYHRPMPGDNEALHQRPPYGANARQRPRKRPPTSRRGGQR